MRVAVSIITGVFSVAITGLGTITLLLLAIFLSNFHLQYWSHLGILIFTLFTGTAALLALPCYLFVSTPRREIFIYSTVPLWFVMNHLYSLPAARGLIH